MKYKYLLQTYSKKRWEKIGIKRRAGIVVPLFSIFSRESVGMGDILDLKILIDWCAKTGNTILELLPLNDTGFDFCPYNADSSFAIDPIYLSFKKTAGGEFRKEINDLRKKFRINSKYADYRIKKEKIKLFKKIFFRQKSFDKGFEKFKKENKLWLDDYCLYRILKDKNRLKDWERWENVYSRRELKKDKDFKFWQWIQWQLYKQLKEVKKYAESCGVYMKGDIPFLIARDSSDVWANKKYFDLNYASGAPPDDFSSTGQRWGMPPYKWSNILKDDFRYIKERFKYASNFYHMARIDHVPGIFRIFKIPTGEPIKNQGMKGEFDPREEKLWEKQGRRLLSKMIKSSNMLLCAEDLGTVPSCSHKVLEELGILRIHVKRWTKDYSFFSVSTLSTHDTLSSADYDKGNIEKNIKEVYSSPSIFCINLLNELLALDEDLKKKLKGIRFNTPSTVSEKNWSARLPLSLEEMLEHPVNSKIRNMAKNSKRS